MDPKYEIKKYTHDIHPESHIHEYYEIFISLANEGFFFVEEHAYPLAVGTIFFLKPFEIHHCFCHGNRDYDRYVIHFRREHLQELSTQKTNLTALFDAAPLVQQMTDEVLGRFIGVLAAMIRPAGPGFGADLERNINFDFFLLEAARFINAKQEVQTVNVKYETRVNEILDYIHLHYAEALTLDELSGQLFISKSRMCQIFKKATGLSVGNYITVYRIKRSCALLLNGESVQNAGRIVGFNNNTHFIRMFKKHMNCSPGRFLKEQDRRK